MSKGSRRRPCLVSDKEMSENWARAFGKKGPAKVRRDRTKIIAKQCAAS